MTKLEELTEMALKALAGKGFNAKNSGSQASNYFNKMVAEGHPCELFHCDDGSYICRVYS